MKKMLNIPSYEDYLNEQKMENNVNILNLKSPTDLSGFYVVYKGSTLNEKPGWYGISHLMEHLMCKNYKHLYDDFDRQGIDWNAYTSGNEIVFFISGLDKYVSKWKNPFLKSLQEFKITDEVLQGEKKIVLEEYDQSFSNQLHSHMLNLERKLFNSYGPIGLRRDIEGFTLEDCREFFDMQFAKPSMIINVSKSTPFEESIDLMTKANMKKDWKYLNENKTEYESINDFKKSSTILGLTPIVKSDFGSVDFLTDMLGSGLQSPLYQEIREKRGLTYGVYSYTGKFSDSSTIAVMGCQTDKSKIDAVKEALQEVIDNPTKYLTKSRFDVVKESLSIEVEKSNINRYNHIHEYLVPEEMRPSVYLKTLSLDKVMETFDKYFKFNNLYISVDKTEFE